MYLLPIFMKTFGPSFKIFWSQKVFLLRNYSTAQIFNKKSEKCIFNRLLFPEKLYLLRAIVSFAIRQIFIEMKAGIQFNWHRLQSFLISIIIFCYCCCFIGVFIEDQRETDKLYPEMKHTLGIKINLLLFIITVFFH